MEWIEPVEVKSLVKYSSPLVHWNGEDSAILSGQCLDDNLAWFASADQLYFHSSVHNGIKHVNLQCLEGQEFQVTCTALVPGEKLALIGLSSITGSGAVALYNYSTSLILKSWSISHKVSSVCTIEMPHLSYRQLFKSECFLFGLGSEEGHVMLLAIDHHFKLSEGSHHLDLQMVHYATIDEVLHKKSHTKPPMALLIPLNDSMYRGGRFVVESMHESQSALSIPQENVCVTAMKYVPQNHSLCVGYNIHGAFQMFSLKTLDQDFSGFAQGFNGEPLGKVLEFIFLEPEDDPRHFCYLTVMAERLAGKQRSPFASLYSLTYVHHDTSPDGVILYEDLQFITLRLEIDFGSIILMETESNDVEDVKLLACKSFSLTGSSNVINSSKPTSCQGSCYFGLHWASSVYLVVFDLNQWYQAQMPSRWIFDDSMTLCPFLGFYRGELRGKASPQLWVQPDSWSIFHRSSVVNPAEAYFYPSALNFRVTLVTHLQAETIFFLGIQSLVVYKLTQAGSQAISQPHRFYIQASKAGLVPPEADIVAPNMTQMAESLLNVGLENNARSFLVSCIKDEGANLNFVEKWAWQQVLNLKSLRESLCQILFDHSTQELEQNVHKQLYRVTHQFNNLSVLYDVMDEKIRALNSGVNDKLRDKSRAVYLLSLHLQTVLWFLHGGLLPEVDENVEECSALPYPRMELEKFYRLRRSEIEALSMSIKSDEVLLIEQLVPDTIRELWAQDSGAPELAYPPPSLYALLSAYLRPDVDDMTKHRIVQYVFLDLTWIYRRHAHYGNILQHLVTFPSTYSLSPSLIKITQAFWHLDHQNFDDALSMLLDPLVNTIDITNVQQRAILRSFLYQEQRTHALKYATLRQPACPELEDIQLHLTILIANSLVGDALAFLRQNRSRQNHLELMQHLLCGCREMRQLSVLFTLPLSPDEEEHLVTFLKQSKNIDLQEALLLFYIQRCNYSAAIAYSECLNKLWPARDAASRERFHSRNLLIQTLVNALPPITCKLAEIANSKPRGTAACMAKFPQPLSVAVLPAKTTVQYSGSAFFRTVMEQSRATWLIEQKLHQESQTPLKPRKRKIETVTEKPDENPSPKSTPFLSDLAQPSKKNVALGMSLTFVSPKQFNNNTIMDTTQMEPPVDTSHSNQRRAKRPRYSLFPKPIGGKTDIEVDRVLQTPPIKRDRRSMAEAVDNVSRPSSILKDKMRRFINFSGFPDQPIGHLILNETQHSTSDHSSTEMEVTSMEVTEAPKHLRFSLPELSPPIEPEALQSNVLPSPSEKLETELEIESSKLQGELAIGEEFLSFEEEKNVEVTMSELEETTAPTSIAAQSTPAQITDQQLGDVILDEQVHLTTLDPVVPASMLQLPGTSHLPIEEPSAVLSEKWEPLRFDQSSDDESEIVCLDSSSEGSNADEVDYEQSNRDIENEDEDSVSENNLEQRNESISSSDDHPPVLEEESKEEVDPSSEEHNTSVPVCKDTSNELQERVEERLEKPLEKADTFVVQDRQTAPLDEVVSVEGAHMGLENLHYVEKSIESPDPSEEEDSFHGDDVEDMEGEDEEEPTVLSEGEDEGAQELNYELATSSAKSRFAFSSSDDSSSLEGQNLPEEDENNQLQECVKEVDSVQKSIVQETEPTVIETHSKVEPLESDMVEEEESTEQFQLQMAEMTPTVITRPHHRRATELHKFSLSLSSDEDQLEEGLEGGTQENQVKELLVTGHPDFSCQDNAEVRKNSEARRSPELTACSSKSRLHLSDLNVTEEEDEDDKQEQVTEENEEDVEHADEDDEGDEEDEDEEQDEEDEDEEQDEEDEEEDNDKEKEEEKEERKNEGLAKEDEKKIEEAQTEVEEKGKTAEEKDEQEQPEEKEKEEQANEEKYLVDAVDSPELGPVAIQESTTPTCENSVEEEVAEEPNDAVELSKQDTEEESNGSSSTDENDLKEFLVRHEVVGIPVPDMVMSAVRSDLSTIAEESVNLTVSVEREESPPIHPENVSVESADLSDHTVDELETPILESMAVESIQLERDSLTQTPLMEVNTLDAAIGDESIFDLSGSLADAKQEEVLSLEPGKESSTRSRSLRLSRVALPFSSRRSIYDGKRDGSPDSVCSEPVQSLSDSAMPRSRGLSVTSQPPPRRSSRLNLGAAMEVASESAVPSDLRDPLVPQTPPRTPSRAGRKRTSSKLSMLDEDKAIEDVTVASVEVSPAGSSFSGSFHGTPVRRSIRLAQRETPDRASLTDAFVPGPGRTRRHSTSVLDTMSLAAATCSPLPSRRSGRRSSLSRDGSPNSVVSEPPLPSEDFTPGRKKMTRAFKSSRKSCTLNLFPVMEESESVAAPAKGGAKEPIAAPLTEMEPSDTIEPDSLPKKGSRTRTQSSTSSSPGPSRYNLRRTRRNSELGGVSEGEPSAPAAEAPVDVALKAVSEETATTEDSTESDPPAVVETSSKRTSRSKRRKEQAQSEEAAEGTGGELKFVRRPRQPRNLPKRDAVIKSRPGPRRSMRLE